VLLYALHHHGLFELVSDADDMMAAFRRRPLGCASAELTLEYTSKLMLTADLHLFNAFVFAAGSSILAPALACGSAWTRFGHMIL